MIQNKYVIGLVGGIGSGKSTTSPRDSIFGSASRSQRRMIMAAMTANVNRNVFFMRNCD